MPSVHQLPGALPAGVGAAEADLPPPSRGPRGVALTSAEYRSHRRELDRLRDLRNRELPQRLREARSFVGADAAEEIVHIQEEQAVVHARMRHLDELLRQARVVDDGVPCDVVAVGHAVEIEYVAAGRIVRYRVAGAGATAGAGAVSAGSPVGSALIGRRAGDTVAVELPGGRLETLRIISVAPAAAVDATDDATST